METNKELLASLEATRKQIDAQIEQLKKQTNELKPEVGKWYKHKNNEYPNWLIYLNENGDVYGFDINGKWIICISSIDYIRRHCVPATDKEVEEALIKEAKRRGFKDGVYIKGIVSGSDCYLKGDFEYLEKNNVLWFGIDNNGYDLFKNGKWAEIVKDEPIKIGSHEVKLGLGDYYKIGCKQIRKQDLYGLNNMMIQTDTNEIIFAGHKITRDTIEKILALKEK